MTPSTPDTEPSHTAASNGTTVQHAADRLIDSCRRIGAPVCVGLDPVYERMPDVLRADDAKPSQQVAAIQSFSDEVLHAVAGHVPCVKFQSACYERYGSLGVATLTALVKTAHELGLQVILDAKRGDIGVSAQHYAAAAFDGPEGGADWLTTNSYLGEDGIRPFLRPDRGVFALVRTSNPGGDALQEQELADGRTIAESVASLVAAIGQDSIGEEGFSSLGAVVGATKPDAARSLRALMPQQIFLVPGFGAQGGGVESVLPCFHPEGTGAIVTASRSVIYVFNPADKAWPRFIAAAARSLADEVGGATGWR